MPSSRLEVIPVIHARSGELVGPDAEPLDEDLREIGRRFSRQHDAVYLVDLDGLRKNKPDLSLLQELGGRVHTWADAGSRTQQDVMDLIIAGAEQVTIRHHTADGPEVVEEAVRLSENVALGMEFRDQKLVENRSWAASPDDLRDLAERLRIPLVVVDHGRAGTRQGVDRSVAWHARHHGPGAYFAGGISSQQDVGKLEDMGYRGALVSTALIEGTQIEGQDWEGPAGHDPDDEPDPGAGAGMDPGAGGGPTGGIF